MIGEDTLGVNRTLVGRGTGDGGGGRRGSLILGSKGQNYTVFLRAVHPQDICVSSRDILAT